MSSYILLYNLYIPYQTWYINVFSNVFWYSVFHPFFCIITCPFNVKFKKLLSSPTLEFPPCFSFKSYGFRIYFEVFNPFWVVFLCDIRQESFKFAYFMCVHVYMRLHSCHKQVMHVIMWVWKSENSLPESILPFHHMAPRAHTQVTSLGGKCLCPLSHLNSSQGDFKDFLYLWDLESYITEAYY